MLCNLTRQIAALATAIWVMLEKLNMQLQITLNMALQNRLTLDLLLLHENGVYGYLDLVNSACCIQIPIVTQYLNEQTDSMRHVAKVSRDFTESMEGG